MIKLSKRLSTISNMVTNSKVVADIGCDHALLDIYLISNKLIKKSIAIDIVEGAINQASININKYNVKGIDLRLGDGLKVIDKKDNIDTIIISGMGGNKIVDILSDNKDKVNDVNTFIIQANQGTSVVRKYMVNNGYYIMDESIVKDNKIIYIITKFKKGNKKYSKSELEYGSKYIKNDKLYTEYMDNLIKKNEHLLNNIPKKNILKRLKIKLNSISIKKWK